MRTVFVGGVHGIGKSTCCRRVAVTLGLLHHSASDLIRQQQCAAISSWSKAVVDPAFNQSLLVQAVRRIAGAGTKTLLLDGHFTIPATSGSYELVPPEVFRELGTVHIVLFRGDAFGIWKRRIERDGRSPTIDEIQFQQDAEWNHAQQVAAHLCIPVSLLMALDCEGLIELVRSH
jgi:adenylate kinase